MEEQLTVVAAGSEVGRCDKVQGHHEGKSA